MAIKESSLTAKQQTDSSIPVYVVPDSPGGARAAYGDELVKPTGAGTGLHKYGQGKTAYSPYAPGTKTLNQKSLEESQRAQAVAEALNQKKFEADQAAQEDASNLGWYNATHKSSSGSDGFTPYQMYQVLQDQQKEIKTWTDKILKETSPTSAKDPLGNAVDAKNKFFNIGANGALHAYPEKALKAYQAMMPEEVFNEVANQVRAYYGYDAGPTENKPANTSVAEFRQLDKKSSEQAKEW